jgi:hypothetical protein
MRTRDPGDIRDTTDETPIRAGSVRSVRAGHQVHIPRRLIVTLEAYVQEGSHKAGAHRLGIAEGTSRQRVSQLMRLLGARTAAEAVWILVTESKPVTPMLPSRRPPPRPRHFATELLGPPRCPARRRRM